jgi:protein-disulfide isomerase
MFGKSETCTSSCITPILLCVLIVLNVFGLFLLTGNSFSLPASISVDPVGVKKALLEIEYSKVGGKANYDIMTQAQNLSVNDPQNPSNIEAMKKYISTFASGTKAPMAMMPTAASGATMTPAEIAVILSGAALEGNKSADIVAIEYSDMECPFCIKQYHDTKIQESLRAQYGDKVAFAFKNNRGVNHPGTEAKALGALCAKKVGGDKAYIGFYHAIMDGTTQGSVYPVSKLGDIAKNLSLDMAKWQSCVDSKVTLVGLEAETTEAQKYGMGGTPGTLLLNIKTGKYATVE